MDDRETLVASIYDCAANPGLWPRTLDRIRDRFGAAYVLVGFADMSPMASGNASRGIFRNSQWDESWFQKLYGMLPMIPGGEALSRSGIDTAWTQMSQLSLEEFRRTPFYETWVKPQNLGDCMNTPYLQRQTMLGVVSIAGGADRPFFGAEDRKLAEALSPHIRRAMSINDIVDKGKLAVALYRKVLDSLSVAVFLVAAGSRLAYTNAAGDALLSDGNLLALIAGRLAARRAVGTASALEDAVERALKGDKSIGLSGIGVPLEGNSGERAAAYVLPIAGDDLRGALGGGYCAVFIAKRSEQQPMAMEVLRTVFDLTQTEARISLLVAQGDAPAAIAGSLGISVNTVRSHLARAFSKTGTGDQTALGALVNGLLPPIAATQP